MQARWLRNDLRDGRKGSQLPVIGNALRVYLPHIRITINRHHRSSPLIITFLSYE